MWYLYFIGGCKVSKRKAFRSPFGFRRRIRRALRVGGAAEDRTAGPAVDEPVKVTFRNGDGEVVAEQIVDQNTLVLSACKAAGIELDHFCGGQCSCGTCRVIVVSGGDGLSRIEPRESLVLGPSNTAKGCRLGCQARVQSSVDIQIPRWF